MESSNGFFRGLHKNTPLGCVASMVWKKNRLQRVFFLRDESYRIQSVKKTPSTKTVWWLNQPIWKKWVKMGSSSPRMGVKIKNNLKPPPRYINKYIICIYIYIFPPVKIGEFCSSSFPIVEKQIHTKIRCLDNFLQSCGCSQWRHLARPQKHGKNSRKQVVWDPWTLVSCRGEKSCYGNLTKTLVKQKKNMLYFVPSLKQTAKSPMKEAKILPTKR